MVHTVQAKFVVVCGWAQNDHSNRLGWLRNDQFYIFVCVLQKCMMQSLFHL